MRTLEAVKARIPPESAVSPVLWYAVLGGPSAYGAQMGLLYWLTEAECSPTGEQWGISLGVWAVVVTAVTALATAGAWFTALWLYRRTGDRHASPPSGRIAFLAIVGMTVGFLSFALILMTGAGLLTYQVCNQS